jgi:hypothetical protein
MLAILAALTSGCMFALQQLIMKRHAASKSTPLFVQAQFGMLAPIWVMALLLLHGSGKLTFNFEPQALMFTAAWGLVTVTSSTILIWLFRTFSLTELAGYRKALVTLGALIMDIVIFRHAFPAPEIFAISTLLAGALLLSHSRNRLPSLAEFAILVGWCGVMTAQITFYKEGLNHQPHILANTILMQATSSSLCALLWLLPQVRQAGALPVKPLLLMLACNLTGTVLEGFAYAGLPLAVLMVLTILPSTLFAAHDLWHGHLPRHPRAFLALGLLAMGFILLVIFK